jgi:hypothetical protein
MVNETIDAVIMNLAVGYLPLCLARGRKMAAQASRQVEFWQATWPQLFLD